MDIIINIDALSDVCGHFKETSAEISCYGCNSTTNKERTCLACNCPIARPCRLADYKSAAPDRYEGILQENDFNEEQAEESILLYEDIVIDVNAYKQLKKKRK